MNEYNIRYVSISILAISIFVAFVVIAPVMSQPVNAALITSSDLKKAGSGFLKDEAKVLTSSSIMNRLQGSSTVQKACSFFDRHRTAVGALIIGGIVTAIAFSPGTTLNLLGVSTSGAATLGTVLHALGFSISHSTLTTVSTGIAVGNKGNELVSDTEQLCHSM